MAYYDPPNLTYPFGAYVCVVDIDKFTGEVKVRRFYALDDCGTRINPMIIEGQIHGGLTEAFAVALGQQIPFDENGNHLGNSLMDYFLPTAVETPHWETDHTVTPSPAPPARRQGRGRVAARGRHPLLQQRRGRRLRPPGRDAHGHAAQRLPRLAAVPRAGHRPALRPAMKVALEKTFPLPASADAAWALLQDMEAVAGCMPGATHHGAGGRQPLQGHGHGQAGAGQPGFRGEVEVKDIDAAARSLRLVGRGTDTTGTSGAAMDLHGAHRSRGRRLLPAGRARARCR